MGYVVCTDLVDWDKTQQCPKLNPTVYDGCYPDIEEYREYVGAMDVSGKYDSLVWYYQYFGEDDDTNLEPQGLDILEIGRLSLLMRNFNVTDMSRTFIEVKTSNDYYGWAKLLMAPNTCERLLAGIEYGRILFKDEIKDVFCERYEAVKAKREYLIYNNVDEVFEFVNHFIELSSRAARERKGVLMYKVF